MLDGLQSDMLQITIRGLILKLRHNKVVTFTSFLFLIISIFFIQIHPSSVWYYFFAGFFLNKMLALIIEKSSLKFNLNKMLTILKKQNNIV